MTQHKVGPTIIGWDLSDGVETHVESVMRDGVLHIIDMYEIINHTPTQGAEQEHHDNTRDNT